MASTMVMMSLLGFASAAYQGGGEQTYDSDDEHLSHGGPGGHGSKGDRAGVNVFLGMFCMVAVFVVLSAAVWYGCFAKKKEEQKPQPVSWAELTVGADLEEAIKRKESKSSVISTAPSDVPLAA